MDRSLERKQRRHYADGEVIFKQGDTASEMYIIYEGKVQIYRDQDGHETELAMLGADEFFGEMALFDSRPRSASAKAVGDVEVRVISGTAFADMQADPVVRQLLTTLAARLRAMDDAIEKISVESDARREYMSTKLLRREWLT